MFAVVVDIGQAHHHRMTGAGFWQRFLLARNDHRTTAKRKLDSVFSYAQPFYESKGATEPIRGFAHISIRKHWDKQRWKAWIGLFSFLRHSDSALTDTHFVRTVPDT
jgi:hypothetical protein